MQYTKASQTKGKIFKCSICNIWVDHTTKHCGECNRCVKGFDHHCMFMNNCIGAHNYKYFIALIYTYASQTIMTIIIAISGYKLHSSMEESGNKTWVLVLWKWSTISLTTVESIALFATLALIVWNIFIRQLGISTYQFLTERETLSKNKEKLSKG